MFLPPAVMMMSFLRPVILMKPSSSNSPMSPVWSQPSTIVSARRLLVLVVALEDVRALDEDLAVVGDPDLAAGEGFADRADLEVLGRGDRRRGRGLGHPPALEDEHPGGVEEAEDLRVDRRRAGDREADLAAEQAADFGEDFLVGELVLAAQQEARLAARAFDLAHPLADPDRPVEDRLFEAALLLHRRWSRRCRSSRRCAAPRGSRSGAVRPGWAGSSAGRAPSRRSSLPRSKLPNWISRAKEWASGR